MISISAVIPCYNQGAFLEECIASILNQSSEVAEIIVVNDGSTETETITILENLSFPKTRVISQTNQGLSAARNTGFRNATGTWILVVDADDYFASEFVEKAVKAVNNDSSIGAVSSWVQFFGKINHVWECTGGDTMNFLIKNNSCAAALVKKSYWEQLSGYDTELSSYEDWDFWIRLTNLGLRLQIIKEPLFFYRKHSVSMLAESEKNYQFFYRYILNKNREIYARNLPEAWLMLIEENKSLKNRNLELEFYRPKSLLDLFGITFKLTKRYINQFFNTKV